MVSVRPVSRTHTVPPGRLYRTALSFPDRLMCGVPEIALFGLLLVEAEAEAAAGEQQQRGDQFLRVAVHGEQVLAYVRQTFRERVGEPHSQAGALHGQRGAQLV